MATPTKFFQYVEDLHHGVHDFSSDQLTVALCAAANAPTTANAVLADLTTVALTYLSDANVTTGSSSQTSGTYNLVLTDKTLLASGGAVGPFRYVVLYNNTPAASPADPLVMFVDYGADLTLNDGEDLLVDFANPSYTST